MAFLGTRPIISESHSEISTRVPFCIGGRQKEIAAKTEAAAAGAMEAAAAEPGAERRAQTLRANGAPPPAHLVVYAFQ